MALFKVTTKRLILSGGKRLEAGMTAEVPFNDFTLPLYNSSVKGTIRHQFAIKYAVDFPASQINLSNLTVEKDLIAARSTTHYGRNFLSNKVAAIF